MPNFSKEVVFFSEDRKAPVRKVFRVDANNKAEAKEILNKMAELYIKKLEGRKPIDDASKLKSVPREASEVSERTVQMLKKIFQTK